ncbi:MAG: FtsX-like permease family protein [Sphingobacteriales bacterium]|nr:MAG: FtsX-like permease family protein [Sphingobacteriales bacterium]
MFNKYFKISVRHLWRQKLFTILNIFGLAISISACWIIYRIVKHEFSYEENLAKKENIFKAITVFEKDGKDKMGGVSAPLYAGIRNEITGLEHVVPVFGQWINSLEITHGIKKTIKEDPENIIATDAAYFEMLPYQWLAGNKVTALSTPNAVVLTESRAKEYFPAETVQGIINQTITYYSGDTVQRTVTGIVADYYEPSEFKAKEFFSLKKVEYSTNAWTNTNGSDQLYLQVKDKSSAAPVLQQINKMSEKKWQQFKQETGNDMKMTKSYELVPIKDMHFATDVSEHGINRTNKNVLYGLMGIAIFLLLLACINYINISIAQIPQRGKEIGVRKTLGSSSGNLIVQFLTETLFTTVLASLLACVFSQSGFGLLKEIIPQGVVLLDTIWEPIVFTALLMIIISLFAGIYPAWLITKVKTINAFKNFSVAGQRNQSFSLQKVLIVFQFVIALFFITITFVAGSQLRYTLQADMGFNKDAVLLVNIPWKHVNNPIYKDKQFTVFNQLKKQPGIAHIAFGTAPLSSGYSSSPFEYAAEGKPIVTDIIWLNNDETSRAVLASLESGSVLLIDQKSLSKKRSPFWLSILVRLSSNAKPAVNVLENFAKFFLKVAL